jgi:hypothetical protein
LNVNPLSRLNRIPLHQSPVEDPTLPLPDSLPNQPLQVWEMNLEWMPAWKAAFLMTREQSRAVLKAK